jgi:hypothetical protein
MGIEYRGWGGYVQLGDGQMWHQVTTSPTSSRLAGPVQNYDRAEVIASIDRILSVSDLPAVVVDALLDMRCRLQE